MHRVPPLLLLATAAIFPFRLLAQQQQQQQQQEPAPAAETVVRTLPFTHAGAARQMQELATILRSCVEPREVLADAATRVITVRGKAAQTELAAWLLRELDLPAADTLPMPVRERRAAAEADDFIRVITLARGVAAHRLQEVATVVRAVSGLRRVFTYNQQGAIVLRGTANELKMAEWLTAAFDRPDTPVGEELTYESAGADDRVRVFYLRPDLPAQSQQELATIARAVADIRSVFTVSRPVAIVAGASVAQVAMAEWLIRELDPSQQQRSSPPVTAQAAARPPFGALPL